MSRPGVPLPTVKLDLPPGGCASYYLGIMHQPDKVGSFLFFLYAVLLYCYMLCYIIC